MPGEREGEHECVHDELLAFPSLTTEHRRHCTTSHSKQQPAEEQVGPGSLRPGVRHERKGNEAVSTHSHCPCPRHIGQAAPEEDKEHAEELIRKDKGAAQ